MKTNSKKILVLSGIAIAIGLVFEFVTPPLYTNFVKKQLNLLPESDVRGLYLKTPFFVDLKVYMFNLTNPDEVTKGGKPKLQEIGPYFFEEWKEKFDLSDNNQEDTLRYRYKNTFKFRPDLSGPCLTGNEIITMPHPLMATMLMGSNLFKNKKMMQMMKTAIDTMFNSPQHIFYTGRAMDILFDGIPIDCSSETFQVQAVCSAFEVGEAKAARPINATHYAFSLLAAANATNLGEFKVYRGYKNSADMGRVVSFNNKSELDVWYEDECNQYRGTDSTIFPPYMDENDGIYAYEPSICRSLGIHYVGKSKYMGIDTSEFALDIGSPENSKQCYCRSASECPKKGTFDMFPCVGAPMIGSQPHFYGADPCLVANFASGINPVKEDHAAYLHFEMTTGSVLSGAKRLQFNLDVAPIQSISYAANLREMYYPMFWLEESVALNETYVSQIKLVTLVPKIQQYMKWAALIFGVCGIIISGISMLLAVKSSNKRTLSPNLESKNGVHSNDKQIQ